MKLSKPRNILPLVIASFVLIQISIIFFAANGPFPEEGIYATAGLRILQGFSGDIPLYLKWLNGSPFIWPIFSAVGYWLGGLEGARLVALAFSLIALAAFAKATANLFGESAAAWAALALGVNGLFIALAHFAVYDVPALAGLGLALWLVTESAKPGRRIGPVLAGLAFAFAVLSKYGSGLMIFPLLALLAALSAEDKALRNVSLFVLASAVALLPYGLLAARQMYQSVTEQYLTLGSDGIVSRAGLAYHLIHYSVLPLLLATLGLVFSWRGGQRQAGAILFSSVLIWPAFHWIVGLHYSAYKHVVIGFLFAYPLAGLVLDKLWNSRAQKAAVVILLAATAWGGVQWYWQEYAWPDIRPAANYLAQNMQKGDRLVTGAAFVRDISWPYAMYLYPRGVVESPWMVYDHVSIEQTDFSICDAEWLVGEFESGLPQGEPVAQAAGKCGYQPQLSVTGDKYYIANDGGLKSSTFTIVAYRAYKFDYSVWRPVLPAPFPRDESATAVVDGKLYLAGGYHTDVRSSDELDRYDPATDTWTELAAMPELIADAGTAVDGETIYVAGGYAGEYPAPATDHVWKYDIAKNTWSAAPPLPAPRTAGVLVRLNRELHFLGGGIRTEGELLQQDFDSHWILQLDGGTKWREAAPMPDALDHFGAAVLNGNIYALGGMHVEDVLMGNQTSVYVYDPASDRWSAAADLHSR